MLVYDVHIFYYFSIYWSDTSLVNPMQVCFCGSIFSKFLARTAESRLSRFRLTG